MRPAAAAAVAACRKVPSDLSRMTILQRYLASIGVISLSNTRSGKYPSLGSGYPSSSSSQFFHSHTAQAAVAAAAAAAAGTRGSAGKAARAAAVSPSPSHQYDMYDEEQQEQEQQLLQQQQEYEQVLAYQQHAAAECEEDHQQHYGQQYGYEQQYSEHTAAAAAAGDAECEGAAAGLLQLARAALMHLEEEEEDEEADGSHAVKQEVDDADMQEDAAGSGLARAQAQLRQLRASSSRQSGRHAAGGSQGGGWGKPELLPVVRSNSEDSDHTAEEEEGSPMAEANLKLQLQQALRPSSSSRGRGKRSPQGGSGLAGSSMPGSKRHRPMWQQSAGAAAGTAAPPRLRPVLDVSSEPAASSYGGGHSLAAGEHSPASPTPLRGSSSPAAAAGSGMLGQPEPHAQLLALMMQAFMGAAAAGAASSGAEGQLPAAALSANHLAAVARIMQLSGLAAGPASAAAAAAGSAGSGAAAGSGTAVADMLAAMMQGDAAAGAAPSAAWSSTLEQHVRAAAGQ
jgi:hypothetical protein